MEAHDYFEVYFNKGRQYFEVHIHNVKPKTFYQWAKTRWAFYWVSRERNRYRGYVGEVHFIKERLTLDTVEHELRHLVEDWARLRGRDKNNVRYEENTCIISDEICRNFWRAWGRYYSRTTIPIP